jgi:hypothetical protein
MALVLFAAVTLVACDSANPTPTAPSPPGSSGGDELLAVDASCPATLLVGQKSACVAIARYRSGRAPVLFSDATWSTSAPDVVAVDALGVATGRSGGQAVISASYQGRQGSASVAVTIEDALRIGAATEQGEFRPGTTVTMTLLGYYSVASAETGRLSLRVTDQAGATVTTSAPRTVSRGGDFFTLSATFVVPRGSTQVCRTAVLEVGATVVAEPRNNESGLWCLTIRQ